MDASDGGRNNGNGSTDPTTPVSLPSAVDPSGVPVELSSEISAGAPSEPLVVVDAPKPAKLKPKQRAFLAALSKGLITKTAACESVKVCRQTFYNWINAVDANGLPTPEALAFQIALEDAERQSVDVWMRQLTKVGLKGWWEPVFDKSGNKCGRIWKYDSKVLQMVAQKLDPSFRQRHEITGANGAPLHPSKVEHTHKLDLTLFSDDELEDYTRLVSTLASRGGTGTLPGQN